MPHEQRPTSGSQTPEADHETYVRIVQPMIETLDRLLGAARVGHDRLRGQADPGSAAIRDFAATQDVADGPFGQPAEAVHGALAMLLTSAVDTGRCVCTLLADTDRPAIFGPYVLGRAFVEALARAAWIAGGPTTMHRVGRALSEMRYSKAELVHVGNAGRPGSQQETLAPQAGQRIEEYDAHAAALGLELVVGRSATGYGEARSSTTSLVRDLMTASGLPDGIGALLYNYWSGMAHGTLYALVQKFAPVEPSSSLTRNAAIYTDSNSTLFLLVALCRTQVQAFTIVGGYLGWLSPEWELASAEALRRCQEVERGLATQAIA